MAIVGDVKSMHKYYCDQCLSLYNEIQPCENCGTIAVKEIWIEVHNQSDSNKA
jgi:rubredoxin